MDIGVMTVALGDEPLEDALEYLPGIGVDAVELGCGGFPGDDHLPRRKDLSCDPGHGLAAGRSKTCHVRLGVVRLVIRQRTKLIQRVGT